MGDKTAIAWTDSTWNPLVGCSRVSEGCRHCYAEQVAHSLVKRFGSEKYKGLTRETPMGEARWTGEVRLVEKDLGLPFRWRRGRKIFVNSMSDLFHEDVPNSWIATIFGVMALSPRHTFQILTKRPRRMLEWTRDLVGRNPADALIAQIGAAIDDEVGEDLWAEDWDCILSNYINGWSRFKGEPDDGNPLDGTVKRWPLPNVWLGVSVENQETADARLPLLLQTPAAVRWCSYEPALGPVDFRPWIHPRCQGCGAYRDAGDEAHAGVYPTGDPEYPEQGYTCGPIDPALSWLVVGGESGPKARPFDPRWAMAAQAQCAAAGVAFFMKQVGDHPVFPYPEGSSIMVPWKPKKRGGSDPAEWHESLRVQEFPR